MNSWYYKVYNYEDLLLNLTYYNILVIVTKGKPYTFFIRFKEKKKHKLYQLC